MASPYFSGTTPGSYLPQGFMQAATAPGRAYAAGIEGIGRRLEKARERKKDDEYFDFIERMAKAPKTKSEMITVPTLTERNRPATSEAAGDYFNEQLKDRDTWQSQLDWLDSLEGNDNVVNRLKAYADDENLPANHPLQALIGQGESMMDEERQAHEAEMTARLNETVLNEVGGAAFGQLDSGYAKTNDLPEGHPLRSIMEQGQQTSGVLKDSIKQADLWLKDYRDGMKGMLADSEKNLDNFMAGKNQKGKPLMELVDKEVEAQVPMSIKERRDIVMKDLSGIGKKIGRERYKEARSEVDKLLPRTPELDALQKGGLTIITQDGEYKIAMATPKVKGNSMFEQLPEAVQKLVPGMQDDARKDPTIKGYVASYVALGKLQSSAALGTGAGDLALITAFMKALDPESVVRESEMASAQGAAPAMTIVKQYFNQLLTGAKLDDLQRKEILKAGKALVDQNRKDAGFIINDFREKAIASGISSEVADKLILPKMPGDNPARSGATHKFDPVHGIRPIPELTQP